MIVILVIISLRKKTKKPINIEINKILKKFSFLLNFPEKPIIINTDILKYQYFVLVSIERIFNIDVKVELPCSIDDSIETMSLIDSVFSI